MKTKTLKRCMKYLSVIMIFIFSFLLLSHWASQAGSPSSSTYIVQGSGSEPVATLVEFVGGKVSSRLDIIKGVCAYLTSEQVQYLSSQPEITGITQNARVHAVDLGKTGWAGDPHVPPETNYPEVVGADIVWDAGVSGAGVTVAVIDSGIETLEGLEVNSQGDENRILAWFDAIDSRKKPDDKNGHGTHIAGIIANSDIGIDGSWNGIAPGVNLVGVRVLNKAGYGTYEQVIKGIQWAVEHKIEYNIRVINLSLVSPVLSPYWADPLNQAVMQAWANGIVVVVAAGNGGPEPMTIGVPGNNPYVITVGAFTDNYTPDDWSDDYITPFSAAGPTLDGFVKPDVVAPGAHIHSLVEKGDQLIKKYPETYIHKNYASIAGTSQSSAVVSGIVALTLANDPGLTPDQVKYRMMYAAEVWIDLDTTDALYSMWQQGSGRVNAPGTVFGQFDDSYANYGMDIWADLSGDEHYEGFSYFDEDDGEFKLLYPWNTWEGGYGSWAGGYGSWASGYGSWAGGYGSWAGGFGSWAGGYGSWAGSYGSWAGGYGSWAGGYGSWAGSIPWMDTPYADTLFVENFLQGSSPEISKTITSINIQPAEYNK